MPAGCKALLCALQIGAAIPPAPGILSRTKKSSPAGGCIVLYAGYIAATSPTSPHSTTNHGCNTGAPSLLLFFLVGFPNICFFQVSWENLTKHILLLIIYVHCLFTTMTTFIPAQILVALCVVGSAGNQSLVQAQHSVKSCSINFFWQLRRPSSLWGGRDLPAPTSMKARWASSSLLSCSPSF